MGFFPFFFLFFSIGIKRASQIVLFREAFYFIVLPLFGGVDGLDGSRVTRMIITVQTEQKWKFPIATQIALV